MNNNKRITVLMSVYNGEKFLREAIDSILNQTYKDFDFVIYDDCSTDSSGEIIRSYADPRIVYRRNEVNQGLTHNLADGFERAETDYIARMDADDIAYPERLAKQVAWMDEHPDVTILGTPVSYFNKSLGDSGISEQPEDDATIKATLFISFTLMHPSIMIRREDLVQHGLNYNPDYPFSQDHALYLDCIRVGLKFANYPEPLLHMRAHGGSISRARHGQQQECSQRARSIFLKATGLDEGCSEFEIDSYNTFASGYFPETPEKVKAYEGFVKKVISNKKLSSMFNKDILLTMFSEKLCNGAYHAIEKKKLRKSVLVARKSSLKENISEWPIKMKLKFFIKYLMSFK